MKVDFVNPFVAAAREVLRAEAHCEAERGPLALDTSGTTSSEVSAVIAVTGAVRGLVLYTMSQETACNLAARMIGQECSELDELAQSAIAELANMITGKAGVLLEQAQFPSDISPPALVIGNGATVSTLELPRLVVPFRTEHGEFAIHVALKNAA